VHLVGKFGVLAPLRSLQPLAIGRRESGRRQQARRGQQAVALNSALPLGYLRLAEAAIQLHQFDRARDAIAQARKLDPQAPELAHLEARLSEQYKTNLP